MRIFDTSVRDGLTGLRATPELRMRCIETIAAMGVDVIEVGMIASVRDDDEVIRRSAEELRGVCVCCLAHPNEAAIRRAGEALTSAESARLHVFNPIRAEGDADERLDEIVRTVKVAREVCEEVEWSALDATRVDREFLLEAVAAAVEAGARTVGIPDTRGHALPSEMMALIGAVRGVIGERDDVVISAHCHDDLGLGLANSLAAVGAGARQVECTVGGIGPQGGNTPLEKVVTALRARRDALPGCGDVDLSLIDEASCRLAACRGDGSR